MPRGRGGARQGTPGVGYSNRTDLMSNRAPQTADATAAQGGVAAPRLTVRQPTAVSPPLSPDQTPSPTDPTAYPGTDAPPVPFSPPALEDEALMLVRSLAMVNPNPDLRRLIARMENR